MLKWRHLVGTCSVALTMLSAGTAMGQSFPSKPVRIVTAGVGGLGDVLSRLIASGLTSNLGQQVIVDNRSSSLVATEVVAKAAPDGYTMLLSSGSVWVVPLLQKTSYDATKDFSPVTMAASAPLLLVVRSSLPVRSVKELIAMAKAQPGALNYAAAPTGTPFHLAAELFKSMASVNIVYVPYKNFGLAVIGLLGDEAQMTFDVGVTTPHIKSGKLRALAVTSARPSSLFPELPTLAETLPGYEAGNVNPIFVPSRTPVIIITRLNQEILRVLNTKETKDNLFNNFRTEVTGSSPEQLAAYIKTDILRMGKVIKDAGIRTD